MLLEDDMRLIVGLYGWKLSLRRLHPDNPVYVACIYWQRRKHCLGLLGEVQCMSVDQLIALLLTYADSPEYGVKRLKGRERP